MSEQEKRTEKIDMVKHFYTEWEYRHRAYWELLYKTIFAIITVMSLPYFLAQSSSLLSLLWLFPTVGGLLCIFSFLLLSGESARITALPKRMNNVLFSIDENYKEYPFEKGILNKIRYFKITNLLLLSYLGLLLLFVAQLVFILSGNFVVPAIP